VQYVLLLAAAAVAAGEARGTGATDLQYFTPAVEPTSDFPFPHHLLIIKGLGTLVESLQQQFTQTISQKHSL
jgi:hypothetical protein